MAGDYARSVQILVEIAGNPEAKLDEINKKLSSMEGRKTTVGIGDQPVNQVNRLSESLTKTNSSFGSLGNTVQSFGSKVSTAFSGVKSSLGELNTGIQNLATGLAGIAIGGAVSGIAWIDSAKSKLYNEQIEAAINNNKKLGISYKELEEFAKQQESGGEGTKSANIKETYAILNYGQKFFKGSSQDKLKQADAIGDFWFANQERMKDFGYSDPEQLVKMLTRTSGKMQGRMVKDAAAALGLDENAPEMKSAKSRMKYLKEMGRSIEEGGTIDMKKALDDRPWIRLETSITKLKKAIGSSIAEPMAGIVLIIASIADLVTKIPGLPMLIGMAGATLALASAAGLLIGVLTPLWTLMKAINTALGISTTLKGINTAATAAATAAQASEAASHAMLTGAMGSEFLTEELTTGAKNVGIVARLRAIGVMAAERMASLATTAANWLGIPALLGLAGANTTAAAAATGMATAEAAALSPLLLLAAAGLILVGVFGLILQKAGILEPLLKGISKINLGKVFKELGAGDLTGAWHQLTKGFELPSMKEAFTNLLGPSMTTTLTKVFGITMNRMLEWLNSINDELKRIRALWDYIIGLLYKYIWEPLKGIWESIKTLVEKTFGKELTKENIRESDYAELIAWLKKQKDEKGGGYDYIPETAKSAIDLALTGIDPSKITKDMVPSGIASSNENFERFVRAVDKLEKHLNDRPSNPVSGAANFISGSIDKIFGTEKKVFIDDTGQKWNLNLYSDGKYKFRKVSDFGFDIDTPNSQVPNEVMSRASGDLEGRTAIFPNALGGIVTKSGLAWVDTNEPIVPAEVNRNSHLINVLESIAGGSSNSVNNSRGNIIVNVDYKVSGPGSGNGMYLDKFAFERAVTEIIGKVTRHYGAY